MGKIIKLPSDVVAKIAAGEVIERPAFAVKELVENSLDAKADWIKVSLEDYGLTKLMVSDDGEGMEREDIVNCFYPHTTSKVSALDDLYLIDTYGFRGEALASIAAVSDVVIQSRTKTELKGTKVILQVGNPEAIVSIGMAPGTRVEVNSLFHSVPARKNFLKSPRREYRYILNVLTDAALANPRTRFTLIHNGKSVYDLPSNGDLSNRIKLLLGSDIQTNLLPVNHSYEYIQVGGYITRPQVAVSNQTKSFFFVNNRRITSELLSTAVKEAYGSLLEPKAYPQFVLFLNIPSERVDVNIHPRKEQILFLDSDLVFTAVSQAVSQVLTENNLTYHQWDKSNSSYINNLKEGGTHSFAGKLLKESVLPWKIGNLGKVSQNADVIQLHNTYLITESDEGIVMIDQHAAHERILYEQFLASFLEEKKKGKTTTLKPVVTIELTLAETQVLLESKGMLVRLGFEYELVGETSIKVTQVPLLFKDRNIALLLKEILNDVVSGISPKEVDTQSRKMLAYLACRSAIKAGEKLTKKTCKELIKELDNTKTGYTCPHGRPVKIELSLNYLDRMFKRK